MMELLLCSVITAIVVAITYATSVVTVVTTDFCFCHHLSLITSPPKEGAEMML